MILPSLVSLFITDQPPYLITLSCISSFLEEKWKLFADAVSANQLFGNPVSTKYLVAHPVTANNLFADTVSANYVWNNCRISPTSLTLAKEQCSLLHGVTLDFFVVDNLNAKIPETNTESKKSSRGYPRNKRK